MPKITEKGISGFLALKLGHTGASSIASIAMERVSNVPAGSAENIAWLGSAPSWKEWAEQRVAEQPDAFDYRIPNKAWYNRGIMPLAMINNNKTSESEAKAWVDDFAETYDLLKDHIVRTLVINGESATLGKCYTGKAFFADDHEYGKSGEFANLYATTVADMDGVSVLQAANAILKVINGMQAMPDDQGRKIANRGMTKVLVLFAAGTTNAAAYQAACSKDQVDTGAGVFENPLKGCGVTVEAMSDGELADSLGAEKCVVIRQDARAKPFVIQRNPDEAYMKTLTDDRTIVEKDGWEIAGKEVLGGGYGHPAHAALHEFEE